MAHQTHKICETSLRWILALRQNRHIHRYHNVTHEKFPEVFQDFGHSGGSFAWTFAQAKLIEEIGLERWIVSPHASGYGVYIHNKLETFLK